MTVACLCAAWCTTCEAYRTAFQASARAHADVRHLWVDIEDHADALEATIGGAPDIDNFPTLLVLRGSQPGFYGTVLPHASVLERLILQSREGHLPALRDPTVVSLGRVVRALADSGILDTNSDDR